MPNGGGLDSSTLSELEAAFKQYEQRIAEFAASHGLRINKWYHDAPMWAIGRDQGTNDKNVVWWSICIYYGGGEFLLEVMAWLDNYVQEGKKHVHHRKLLPRGIIIKRWSRGQKIRIKIHLESAHKVATAIREEQLTHNAY